MKSVQRFLLNQDQETILAKWLNRKPAFVKTLVKRYPPFTRILNGEMELYVIGYGKNQVLFSLAHLSYLSASTGFEIFCPICLIRNCTRHPAPSSALYILPKSLYPKLF